MGRVCNLIIGCQFHYAWCMYVNSRNMVLEIADTSISFSKQIQLDKKPELLNILLIIWNPKYINWSTSKPIFGPVVFEIVANIFICKHIFICRYNQEHETLEASSYLILPINMHVGQGHPMFFHFLSLLACSALLTIV